MNINHNKIQDKFYNIILKLNCNCGLPNKKKQKNVNTCVLPVVTSFERVWHESYWVRTGTVSLVRVITWKTRDFMVNKCWRTKFVHRIRWIHIRKHVNWASWTREFTYRTREITGRCWLGWLSLLCLWWHLCPLRRRCHPLSWCDRPGVDTCWALPDHLTSWQASWQACLICATRHPPGPSVTLAIGRTQRQRQS